MKPNFALTLTFETIGLARRTARGWISVGEVATDSPDLAEMLSYLRSKAFGLSPQGVTTKLVLPQSEVLFTEIAADGPEETRRQTVRAALEGMTPYAVDDLVFDIQGDGPVVQVAVVARETLDQAEEFAAKHRFNPLSFVAIAPSGSFQGEAFFGPTAAAAALLPAGETVERDTGPTSPVPAAELPTVASPGAEPNAAPPAEPSSAPATTTDIRESQHADGGDVTTPKAMAAPEKVEEEALPAAAAKAEIAPSAEPASKAAEAAPVTAPSADAPPQQPTADIPDRAMSPAVPPEPAAPATEADVHRPRAERRRKRQAQFAPATSPAPPHATPDAAPTTDSQSNPTADPTAAAEAAEAAPGTLGLTRPQDAPDAAPSETVTTTPAPVPDAPPAFASRRQVPTAVSLVSKGLPPPQDTPADTASNEASAQPRGATSPASIATAPDAVSSSRVATPPERVRPPKVPPEVQSDGRVEGKQGAGTSDPVTTDPAPSRRPPAILAAPTLARPLAAPRSPSPPAGKSRVTSSSVTATALPGKRVQTLSQPSRANRTAEPPDAASKSFGLPRREVAVGGKPRFLGLILTGALLIFLTLVAAWSSLYLSRSDQTPGEDIRLADVADQTDPDALTAPIPLDVTVGDATPETTTAVAEPLPDEFAETPEAAPRDAEVLPAEAEVIAEPAPEPQGAQAALPGETAAADAAAPATTLQGAANAGQDEIFLSALDAAPPTFDAVALPTAAARGAEPPPAPMPPPPFGTVYSFDADGQIAAGARGVVTPDGIWLIAARPPVVPPPRPARLDPLAEGSIAPPTTDEAAQSANGSLGDPVASVFQPDAATPSRRPSARPDAMTVPEPATAAPDAAAQAEDDAALTAPADTRLASLRPRARTPAILALGQAARDRAAEQSASLVQQASAAAVAPVAFAGASDLAVPISRRPAVRPKDFSVAVAAAVATATRTPAPAATAPRQAPPPVAEEDDDEPEPVAARNAPRIPTRADVARQATFTNAINLSRINLIGIYGTSSNRHALVRTPNGRYNKVKVGDRVDGGTVAAITANELRYQKGGRMLALQMPRG